MKRILFAVALGTVLVVPSSAVSSKIGYSSSLDAKRGSSIAFDVVSRNGKPKRVKNFTFSDIPMACNEGGVNFSSDSEGFGPMKVENREFGKRFPFTSGGGGSGTVKIAGEFRKQNTVIRGMLRAKGDFPGSGRTDCDSGRVEWKAT